MRKEIILAVLTGAILGLVIAFGIWRANLAISNNKDSSKSSNQNLLNEEETETSSLSLIRPSELDVLIEVSTVFSGATKPNSNVVISADSEDYILASDSRGAFEQEVQLLAGLNQILVFTFDPGGKISQEKVNVVHSSEFAKIVAESQETELDYENKESTGSSIRDRVLKEVEARLKSPKAYVGTITDISDTTLQINKFNFGTQTPSTTIQQVAIDDQTTFVKAGKTTKEIEPAEVAIGDFIIAMGFQNQNGTNEDENGVLSAKRILVSDPVEITKRTAILGQITEIQKTKVILKEPGGNEYTLNFPKTWKGPDLDELEEGDNLIAIGQEEGSTIKIRTIELVSELEGSSPSPTPKD